MTLSKQPYPTVEEFTDLVEIIDFDWDIGKPLGTLTVTANLEAGWGYGPGSVIQPVSMGLLVAGPQLVTQCQRDAYLPQATINAQAPMTAAQVINPTNAGIQNV